MPVEDSQSETGWYVAPEVVPRQLGANPRCPQCKTGNMLHPAHPFGPCAVVRLGEGPCGCTGATWRVDMSVR